jgi:hypothetical protein
MTTYQTTTPHDHRVRWLLAGFALQGILPWLLSRAAKSAGRRDLIDCGGSPRP